MKKQLHFKSNKIIGLVYIVIGLFLIITNGRDVYAYYSNEHKLMTSFYKNDKDISEIEDIKPISNENNIKIEAKKKNYNSTKTNDYIRDSIYDDYIAVLKIPKISLEKGLFAKTSLYNDVEHNIMIHEKSDNPTIKNGNVILIAHSGTAEIAYFRRLNELKIGDSSEVYYHGKKYTYEVKNIYEVKKTGTVSIDRNYDKNTLTMITCKHDTDMQIVIISELSGVENY